MRSVIRRAGLDFRAAVSEKGPAICLGEGVAALRDVEFRRLIMGERFDVIGIDCSIHTFRIVSKPLSRLAQHNEFQ